MLTRRSRASSVAAALVLAFLSGACGDGTTSPNGDGGPSSDAKDAPQEMALLDYPFDLHSPDWSGACDPVDQNCAPGQECTVNCPTRTEFVCMNTAGTKAPGEDCNPGECARGAMCVGVTGGGAKCRKWCRQDSDCTGNKPCTRIGVTCKPGTEAPMGWLCQL